MFRLVDIDKVYRNKEIETRVLSNINLTIRQGEFVSIMGPSGCGKTTLLNIIGLIEETSSGSYYIDDQLVSNLSERQRTEIRKNTFSYVFQNFNLIEDLTTFENIELPLIYKKVSRLERMIKVKEILERFDLKHRQHYYPGELSGGQQQRVAVARAVVSGSRIILADEPTGNLDSSNGEEILQLLTRLNEEGITIVMVTHSMIHAQRSHRIVHLFDGHIVTETFARQHGVL